MALPNIRRRALLVGVKDFARAPFGFCFKYFHQFAIALLSRQTPDGLVCFFALEDDYLVTQTGVFVGA